MSRIAKNPVRIPKGVEVTLSGADLSVKGPKGTLSLTVNPHVSVEHADGELRVTEKTRHVTANALAGTMRALINNMVTGVSKGFERKLELTGVGYRAQAQGRKLNLSVGFSQPVNYPVPEGITVETPSQTEVIVKGTDKQKVGQVAAEIRGFRPPDPYKGKGVRYVNERVVLKEAKKK